MYNGDIQVELTPGEDQCRWCKAKATCPALADQVMGMMEGEFALSVDPSPNSEQLAAIATRLQNKVLVTENERLDELYPTIELTEIWIRALRAEIERRALAGVAFTTCKIVQGKRGNRSWANPLGAEHVLKSMRVKADEMYEMKLISPTTAEKVLKDSPKRWNRLLPLITQADGPLSVAPMSDRRPAHFIEPLANEFAGMAVTEEVT
jgi:hypothetical protein